MFDRLSAALLVSLFALLGILYFAYFTREIEPFPPANDDQAAYLTELYTLTDNVHSGGLMNLLRSLAQPGSGASVVFPLEGTIMQLITNGGRLAALLVNFLGMFLLFTIAFAAVSGLTHGRWIAIGVLGPILAQGTFWVGAGGLFDYRIDFIAFCLYGAWVCAVIRSETFSDRSWSIIAGLLATALVLNRVLSVLYVVGTTACVIVILLFARWFWLHDITLRIRQRMVNIAISTAILILVSAPFLVVHWPAIRFRYVGLHLFAEDKVARQLSVGIVQWWDNLTYYPWAIWIDHLGRGFLVACIAFCIGVAAHVLHERYLEPRRDKVSVSPPGGLQVGLEVAFLLSSIIVPLAILTANSIKYSSVAGVMGVPIALALTLVPARILAGRVTTRPIVIGSAVAFVIGVVVHLDYSVRRPPLGSRSVRQGWADTVRWIDQDARARGIGSPRLFFDLVAPQWNASAFTAFAYEKSGILTSFNHLFPRSILSFSRADAFAALEQADYVVLTEVPKAGPFPFFATMAELEGDVRRWVDANLVLQASFPVGYKVLVYTRPRPN